MKDLPWYKWEPGSVPYMDRISVEARGLLWVWMDDYWRGWEVPSPLVSASDLAVKEAAKVWPVLKANLDAFKSEAEAKAKSRHISSENANRIRWGSVSDPKSSQEEEVDIEKDKEKKKKEPTSRKRSVMPPKVKNPTEPTMESLYGVLAEAVQAVDPGEVWDHARAKNAYWKIVGHWHPTKNPKPKQTLLALIEATKAGTSIHQIYSGAEAYKEDNYNREHFMAQVSEWVKNEGWSPYIRRAS